MATVTINPLPEAIFALSVTPPSFSQLAADTLSNAGTETDGFDASLQELALALASEPEGVSSLDTDLGEAAFAIGEFSAGFIEPTAMEIGAAAAAGDAMMSDLVTNIGDGTATIPTPIPPTVPDPGAGGVSSPPDCLANPFSPPCNVGPGPGGGEIPE